MRRVVDTSLELDDDPSRVDQDALFAFLSEQSYWARHRTRDEVVQQLRSAARVIGLYDRGAMIGFARAASDRPGAAHLSDVYVLEPYRGRGLGSLLVQEMIDAGPLRALEWSLNTSDAHELYRRLGFERTGERSMVRSAPADGYLAVNRANWDERAGAHVASPDYGVAQLVEDPDWLSAVVRFDRPRLGSIAGLEAVHLQCHIGTDTISLARLGARMTGLDLSPASLHEARQLAQRAGASVTFVEADLYSALTVLKPASFDLVYTGIGALCWLPDIARWAQIVAGLLRPGGRLFIRELHPMLAAVDESDETRLTIGYPYFEQAEPLIFDDGGTYVETDVQFVANTSHEWSHGLGETVSALLSCGMELTGLVEHDSVPWQALPGQMVQDEHGEWRLRDRPERLAASFTLQARRLR